jgi:putative membrane protein
MTFVGLVGMLAASSLGAGIACAQGLNDAQIAHIAYTAGQIDIHAAQQALNKCKSKSPTKTWRKTRGNRSRSVEA